MPKQRTKFAKPFYGTASLGINNVGDPYPELVREVGSLAYEAAVIQTTLLCLTSILFREGIPKPKSFVSCTCNDRFSLRAHRQIKYTMSMTSQ